MSTLIFRSIEIQDHEVRFSYEYSGVTFYRGVGFSERFNLKDYQDDPIFLKLVEYMAITDTVYTFTLEYFDNIELPFALTDDEKQFFEHALLHGMAEFRYVNQIPIHRAITLSWAQDLYPRTIPDGNPIDNNRAFVLNGGGKDSIVAGEIVKNLELEAAWFYTGAAESRNRVIKLSGIDELVTSYRIFDPYLQEKANRKYEGHRPMSLYVAMVSSLAAYLDDRHYAISANEYSASFANLTLDGFSVNHQYTKSFEFEHDLRQLFKASNIPVYYFSITRPLYELQVLKIFSRYPQYHTSFLSCNKGMQEDKWCLECAKCAFVIGAMYLYSPDSSEAIWGPAAEVFNANKLVDELIELINPDVKPLECIGTTTENRVMLAELIKRGLVVMSEDQKNHYEDLKAKGAHIEPVDLEEYDRENNFPPELREDILRLIGEGLRD